MKLTTSFIAVALSLSTLSLADPQTEDSRLGGGGIKPKPLVTSAGLQASVSKRSLEAHARELLKFSQLSNGNRAFGSKGHNATAAYIKSQLDRTGYYDTQLQTFPYLFSAGTSQVTINGTALPTKWFTYGPSGDVTASLVSVNNLGCDPSDYPAALEGKIALIKRGTCNFGLKVANAGNAKAAGAIIFNNAPEAIAGGTLGEAVSTVGPYVAVGSLSGVDGERIAADLSRGTEVVARLFSNGVTEERYTSNVIATTRGGDKNNIVFAGGHTDSVPGGPGINDNGSGAISVLDIALRLTSYSVKNAVSFGFWTAEEFGLIGSDHYVTSLSAEDQQKIALYLNFDMVASPNYGYFIYDGDGSAFNLTGPAGSDHIEKTFEGWFTSKKIKTVPTAFDGRSDYGPFLDVGVPSGGLFTGAEDLKTAEEAALWGGNGGEAYDACYHQACDGLSNLNYEAWVENTRAASHAVATYAVSLEGISRDPRPAPTSNRVAGLDHDERIEYACGGAISRV